MTTAKKKTTNTKAKTATASKNPFEAFGFDAFQKKFEESFNAEKVWEGYNEIADFQKQGFEALVESASLATKSLEALATENAAFAKSAVESAVEAGNAALKAGDPKVAFEVQSAFAQEAVASYVEQVTKVTDMVVEASKEAAEPLNNQFNAVVEKVQAVRA